MAIATAAISATELLVKQWHLFLAPTLVYAAVWILQNFVLKKDHLSNIPFAGAGLGDESKRRAVFLTDAKSIYLEGYNKFKRGIYRITTLKNSPVVVLDPRFLSELKDLPDDQISFTQSIDETMYTEWTNISADRPLTPHIIKRDLTPALNRLNPLIAEEVDEAFRQELPPCKDFTSVNINKALLRLVAKVSGRIFIGPEFCRSEDYIDMAINYTLEVSAAQQAISALNPWKRNLQAGSLPQVKALQARHKSCKEFLQPIISARKKASAEDPDFQKPDDFLQWVLDDGQAKFGDQLEDELTEIQLGLTFAAIHTTTMTTTNAFYSIAAIPEFIPELREEISTVLQEHGTFTTLALQKMKKLDSFLKEVMRIEPIGWSSFGRKVLKDVTLSNGQLIPAGCLIEVAAHGAMNDPELVSNPNEFDPLRSYRLRTKDGLEGNNKAGSGATNQFVSVSATNLTFGYGRHACPGRFFAANEIKMIIGRALLDYDIKMVDGSTGRYPNLRFGGTNIPDPTKQLLFKRVGT